MKEFVRQIGKHLISFIVMLILSLCCMTSCSITAHIPENEVLYNGVDHIELHPSDTVNADVESAVKLALEVPPTNAFFGSAYHRSPLPFGLWAYNAFYPQKETGFRHWLWSNLKSDPKYISDVNPQLRVKAAEAILKDEGYFDAEVLYDTIYNKKDSLQASLAYDVVYHHASKLGKISYLRSASASVDSIIVHTQHQSLLHTGDRFSASLLEQEKNRISATMHDSGYFFFSPDHVKYLGDSTLARSTVSLRIFPNVNGDVKALRPCVIDSVFYHLDYGYGMKLRNFDSSDFMTIGYNGKQTVKTKFLKRALGFEKGALYNSSIAEGVKRNLSRLNAFKYTTTEFQVLNPERDSEMMSFDPANDTIRLMLKVHAENNMPWSGGTEIGAVYKDNQQVGPGITLTAQRKNIYGGGEVFSGELTGSYEWYTGVRGNQDFLLNSFELGTKFSYTIPRLPFPGLWHANPVNPVSSRYSLSLDWQRRGGFFEMVKASASMEYSFSRGQHHTFTITPLRLSYVQTVKKTDVFKDIISENIALDNSLRDQFIPQIQFEWTYSNQATRQNKHSHQYLRLSLAEAGGLIDILSGWWGKHKEQGKRQLWGQQFSQFLKFTAEFRNTYKLTPRQSIVTRILAGMGYAYGNSSDLPYSEAFYIGGANSLRGFAARTVGPGAINLPYYEEMLSGMGNVRLYCVGDYKFEANLEYRFPLLGSLNGALFADAGNIWNFKDEYSSSDDPCPEWMRGNPLSQMAVDCGFGLRYDLGMLVVRFDVGVPLHDPNDYTTNRYFNCREGFFKHLGYNLAVGYPF